MCLGVVLVVSAGAAFVLVRAFGYPLVTALLLAAGLAQIGEFSFILSDLGIGLHLMPERARGLILGTSILTILVNPLLFQVADALRRRFSPDTQAAPAPALAPTRLANHAVLIGYGRVGRIIAAGLTEAAIPFVVIENGDDALEALRDSGIEFLEGNAADDPVLAAANISQARLLLVAIPLAFEAGQIVEQARAARPDLAIIARAHFDAEAEHLARLGATTVIMGEREIALAMLARAGLDR
jgi:CPA2 family monovalent cation:H+ antiporter-2